MLVSHQICTNFRQTDYINRADDDDNIVDGVNDDGDGVMDEEEEKVPLATGIIKWRQTYQ